MQSHLAFLSTRRIARSLVTVLALTLIQTVLPSVVAPVLTTPKANAVTNTYSPAQATEWIVPANVSQISVTIKGGSGGIGGQDCGSGCINQPGGPRGSLSYTFTVTTGDVIGIYPGYKGGNGTTNANSSGGGVAGPDTTPNGTFDGGTGGNAGISGGSGGGGAGGAASVLLINSVIRAVAGGAGGGGGAANVANSGTPGGEYTTNFQNGTLFTGGNGGTTSSCTTTSGGTTNDGGGSGGSGGGYYGGASMPVYAASAGECAGSGGLRGGNYILTNSGTAVIGNTGVALGSETVANTDGSIVIDYTPNAITACVETPQTVDIYRVIKLSASGSCTWTVPAGVTSIDLFAVGGGGAGGSNGGSGGGGGAAISRTALPVSASSVLAVKIGYGGGASFTDGWVGGNGDSTTISFPSGLLLSANGGSMGVKGVAATPKVGGVGGTAVNGGFAGGAGGASATTVNSRGTVGKTGISNYFLGTLSQYGGGGGGGTYKDGCTPLDGQSGASGGAAGASCSSNVNSAGGSALAETGGGGGGGGFGTSGNTLGGKGGSGVILIRYAINAADAFPVTLASALHQRWMAGDIQNLDSSREGFIDSTGNFASAREINGTVTIDTATQGTGSTKSFVQLKGDTNAFFNLENLPTTNSYTLFSIAKYQANSAGRIVTSSDQQWISGFWAGYTGIAFHGQWLTDAGYGRNDVWALSTDQLYSYRMNGVTRANRNDSTMAIGNTLGINNSRSETSNWQLGEVLVFNRELNISEVALVETYLSRLYGIALTSNDYSSETDSALSLDASSFAWSKGSPRVNLTDTFTIEAWVRTTSTCDGNHYCYIYSQEGALVWAIYYGVINYAMQGKDNTWGWISTGVPVKSGEWHHLAISKELTGNRGGSLKFYLDGQLAYTKVGSPYVVSEAAPTISDTNIIGQSNNRVQIGVREGISSFYGNIDEVKVWRGFRTQAQIQRDMHYRDDLDSASLRLYLDFNKTGTTSTSEILNQATKGDPAFNMLPYLTLAYSDVKAVSKTGPYTVVRFPRTYITQSGGWRSPESITAVNYLIAAGGGAGGRGDSSAYEAGGGGAGGVLTGVTTISSNSFYPVLVGVGGLGTGTNPTSGENSSALSVTAIGGGHGGFALGAGASGGSGGGGTHNRTAGGAGTAGQGFAGVTPSASSSGGGGGGATASGINGVGGMGLSSSISGSTVVYGDGGGSGFFATGSVNGSQGGSGNGGRGSTSSNVTASNGVANTGSGGGGANSSLSTVKGGNGGSGVVIVRYITALRPTYTKPVNSVLNAGMTETFTTNVAQDSATAVLTRTFKWESTTAGASGPFTAIKQGTGANNAFFAWVPTDTSTSGSQYLYRLTVTDSDTAGLFISDSSTAFATINPALVISSTSTNVKKAINVSRSETITVSFGTPGYRFAISPVIPGISIESSTATSVLLRISDTATVGTYIETITATDSVSATISIPLTITISAPPHLLNTNSLVNESMLLNLDAGNSRSIMLGDGNAARSISWNDLSGSQKNARTGGASAVTYDGRTCTAPTYYSDFGGYLQFNGSSDCYYTDDIGPTIDGKFTVESWYRSTQTLTNAGASIFTQNSAGNIGIVLGGATSNGTTDIRVGFYNGTWRNSATGHSPVTGVWNHYVGTYDGANFKLYRNGTLLDTTPYVGSLTGTKNTTGYFIGRRWDGSSYLAGSIASLRVYNTALTLSQIQSNFESTKYRFESTNQTILKPSQKYGSLNIETFTVTSGGDTKTVSFATGNRTGISWDTTSIPGQIKLSVQESLTPGPYYDTITVTDNFGQSTSLPITFTVSKADTVTVTAGVATSQVFNNQQATSLPVFGISGLVSSDAGTVVRKYTGIDWTKPCAQGGGCEVGDTGPGGGTIFYISPTVINAVPGISSGGRYLEVAPINWSGLSVESTTAWARVQTSVTGTFSAIGSGAENTRLINAALGTNSLAAKIASDLTFPSTGGKSDWFLPSTLEVKEMYDALYAPNLAGDLTIKNYWSSTQDSSLSSRANTYWFGGGGLVSPTDKLNASQMYLRPIRAYSPDTITVTTVPTNVDSYTVTADTPTMTIGSLDYYQGVIYQRSGLDITQARQDPLRINTFGATFGIPYRISALGGSGSGAVTETLIAGSTATGCAINGDTVTSTTAGICNIQIKKAYSRNYLTETATAMVYFLLWVINQPSPTPGTGPNISISGENDVTIDLELAPMISSLSTYTATAGVTSITIYGVGFNNSDANFEVNFSRGVSGTGPIVNPAKTEITVTVPAGARTGKVTVKTSKGLALSELALTITP